MSEQHKGPTTASKTWGGAILRVAGILELLQIARLQDRALQDGMVGDLRTIAPAVDRMRTTEQVENAIDAGMYLLVAGQFGGRLTAEQANDVKQHILGRLKASEGA